jgi:hypothetical protein
LAADILKFAANLFWQFFIPNQKNDITLFGKTMKNSFKLLILIFLFNTSISYASSSIGHCIIDDGDSFVGPCEIWGGGSEGFSIGALDPNTPLYDDVNLISVTRINKNKAIVRALIIITFDADEENPSETQVLNTSWGEAIRDKKDPSCWNNEGRQICARK